MKRVYCLYRVSTKGQVDKDDIPLQKTACREFATRNGWTIVKELSEKGISGFKVSADDRDAVQDLKAAAERHEFDILLVFMFDRLGRRQNETPFVVEWFVSQGVEVWSTQEGRQCFENEADYLINYMRYWQAGGESRKTSTRVKTRLSQLTAEGNYTGGNVPYGYKLVKSGKVNKKGKELMDVVIDEIEASIVRIIFTKTINEGYGSFRLAAFLNNKGIRTHKGNEFQCDTVNRILKNRMYCGYFISGQTTSPHLKQIQIIDENVFNQAKYILEQRSSKNTEKQQIAKNTKGKTMLSGNLYCAHCGSKMIATSYVDTHIRKDGSKYIFRGQRYICCNKARNRRECDGQSAYVANIIDNTVEKIIKEYLNKIKLTPRDIALEKRYRLEISDIKALQKKLTAENEKLQKRITELSGEIAKSLMGESKFTPEILSTAIDNTKLEVKTNEEQLLMAENNLVNQGDAMKKLDYYYAQFQSWAEEFEQATLEQRKMIACQLIREIRVSRGYEIDIILDLNYQQFFMS